ncbi:Spy/CpxP family protein refolding chaperone [Bosea sp. RAC05]|uniref:Spy/CpxP family protein refolding chaperone n=1 Tax=Bosea sp. RAC05 TaxID=1842539 RepID=UPI00083CC6E8|nr:Spy/CpxP family protein refolding chaperone [Bosea sp. RAC05]AOG04337.1 LTXXQ motif family protein [Bosea sp. RAC05]
MKPFALIAASSIAALAAGFAVAQPAPMPPAGGERDGSRHERSERYEGREQRREDGRERRAERMQERLNERLAKLRTDMKLKPEQVALFDTVEGVIKKRAEERRSGWSAMREQRETFRHADIMERLDMMSGRQAERAARSKELADAVRPLWATLSDEQKTVARRAVREAMAEGRGMMRAMHERMHGGMDQRMEDHRGGRGHHDGERGPRWDRGDYGDRRG